MSARGSEIQGADGCIGGKVNSVPHLPGERKYHHGFTKTVRNGVKKMRIACRRGGSHISRNTLVRAAAWEHRNCSAPCCHLPFLSASEGESSAPVLPQQPVAGGMGIRL